MKNFQVLNRATICEELLRVHSFFSLEFSVESLESTVMRTQA